MVEKIGDWGRVARLILNLRTIIKQSEQIWLHRMVLKGEAIAVNHISAQDLGWKRLKASTIRQKVNQGHSEDIYVATSTYFQNITGYVKGNTGYVGVKKGVTHPDSGVEVGNIAKWLEFGTRDIPARPLWKPTYEELMEWSRTSNRMSQIVLEKMRKY